MSTIKAANIQNPSAASAAIVLDTSGNFSVPAGTVSAPGIQAPSDSNTGIFFPAADTIAFAEGGSEAMRIDSSSRLLVGTSTTELIGVGSGGAQIQSIAANPLSVARFSNDNFGCVVAIGKSRGASAGSYTVVQNNDLLGEIRFAGADGTDLQTVGAQISAEVDGTPGSNDLPSRLVFSTTADGASSPTERMRISANGRVGVFTTDTDSFDIGNTNNTSTTRKTLRVLYSATAVGNGTESFYVQNNGDVRNTNNSYGAISDAKLKENIVDANTQWDDIKALRPVNYNFKEGQTHTQLGLIAQEVELVSPGLVSESPDRDAEGNDLGTVTKSVNYSVLYMKAVKALQEAMERIEKLEAEMAEVKAQLS